jgi:hypothetical protein
MDLGLTLYKSKQSPQNHKISGTISFEKVVPLRLAFKQIIAILRQFSIGNCPKALFPQIT